MAVNAIPVDQRVIDIDSRRFASIEKALVELITNADDSYARLERAGVAPTGRMRVQYERHRHGALLTVADSFEPFLPPDFYKAALAVVVVVNAVLRIYTTQPVCLRGGE